MQSISMTIQNGQALFPKAAQNDYIKTLACLYKNSLQKNNEPVPSPGSIVSRTVSQETRLIADRPAGLFQTFDEILHMPLFNKRRHDK